MNANKQLCFEPVHHLNLWSPGAHKEGFGDCLRKAVCPADLEELLAHGLRKSTAVSLAEDGYNNGDERMGKAEKSVGVYGGRAPQETC
ncbi:MAG: hypothetical protein ACJ0UT_08795 [Candidatus Latescibacterota bacterium]